MQHLTKVYDTLCTQIKVGFVNEFMDINGTCLPPTLSLVRVTLVAQLSPTLCWIWHLPACLPVCPPFRAEMKTAPSMQHLQQLPNIRGSCCPLDCLLADFAISCCCTRFSGASPPPGLSPVILFVMVCPCRGCVQVWGRMVWLLV